MRPLHILTTKPRGLLVLPKTKENERARTPKVWNGYSGRRLGRLGREEELREETCETSLYFGQVIILKMKTNIMYNIQKLIGT